MAIDFGIVKPGRTLYVPFDSFAGSTGASITLTGLAVTDIEIYKDGSVTQRSSDAGYTLLDTDGIDFDGLTGIHGFSINLADNSDAGFYAAGSRYFVVVSSVTVDSQTVSFVACTFSIGQPDAVLNTTIATLASQTSFTVTAGPAEDDALNDMWLVVHDVASAVQQAIGIISDYTGATKTVTLAAAPTFTIAATDNIAVMGPMPMQPATAARKPVVDAAGLVDANAVKVGPTGSGTAQTAGDLAALINTVDDLLDTEVAAILAAVDTEVAAIKAKTDNLPADPADASDIAAAFVTQTGYHQTTQGLIQTLSTAIAPVQATVNDAAASTTVFKTTLTEANDHWNDMLLVITSGALAGQAKPILDYAQTNGTITVSEAFTSAPANGVSFSIVADHIHPVTQIASGVRTELTTELGRIDVATSSRASQTSVDTIDDLLDTEIGSIITSLSVLSTAVATVDSIVDAILLDTGTDGVVVASLTAAAIDSIHDEPITEPTGMFAWASATHRKGMQTLMALMRNEVNSDSDSVDVRNDADTLTLWSYPSSDDGSIYTSGEAT